MLSVGSDANELTSVASPPAPPSAAAASKRVVIESYHPKQQGAAPRDMDEVLAQAAIVIVDACAGRRGLRLALNARERRLHALYYNDWRTRVPRCVFVALWVLISFFEQPPWFVEGKGEWGPQGTFRTSALPYLPLPATMVVELVVLAFFAFELRIKRIFRRHVFWADLANATQAALLALDAVCLFGACFKAQWFYWRGAARIMFIVLRFRRLRLIFVNIVATVPDIASTLSLVGLLVRRPCHHGAGAALSPVSPGAARAPSPVLGVTGHANPPLCAQHALHSTVAPRFIPGGCPCLVVPPAPHALHHKR